MDSNGIEIVSMVAIEDEAEKRAHHNALERKRRDHIKDSFYCLRDAVPQLRGEKASRALILNKATDYIKCLKSKNMCHKKEIDDIKKQNDVLEQEIDKIIKLNNSLGKDKIDMLSDVIEPESAEHPQSSLPTFTRITEKDNGPFIGKRNLDAREIVIVPKVEEKVTTSVTSGVTGGTSSGGVTSGTSSGGVTGGTSSGGVTGGASSGGVTGGTSSGGVTGDTSSGGVTGGTSSSGVTGGVTSGTSSGGVTGGTSSGGVTGGTSSGGVTNTGTSSVVKHKTITLAQLGAPGAGGTIQIPASALAKALPNGLRNVTAIYKQTGKNKPIKLQIITSNGSSKQTCIVTTASGISSKTTITQLKAVASGTTPLATFSPKKTSPKKSPEDTERTPKSAAPKEAPVKETPDARKECETKRHPLNQPIYAKHRPVKEDKKKEISEFDSYLKDIPKVEPRDSHYERKYHRPYQTLPRDPSAMATISESELAFLTRPTNNTGNTNRSSDSRTPNSNKIEHGNIPILFKGSLISERDNEIEGEEPVRTQILLGARATDGSKPFACHICGKSFNMLSSLKVHEHIHVPVKKKPYPCDLCHRSFMTLRILSQHKESHYGRISTFHRQSSLGKRPLVSFATHPHSFATHPHSSKNNNAGHNPHSPRTSITNIFHVRSASPKDASKSFNTVTITPSKNTVTITPAKHPVAGRPVTQRALPTTHVRQGQVIVQARPGGISYKPRTFKHDAEETRNFGTIVMPLKRTCKDIVNERKIKKTVN